MAYRQRFYDEDKIARLYKEGRGQGRGADYLPWLTIYDVASKGRSHRVFGCKTGRIHHFLSDIEWKMFLHLDWCSDVTDIREQFPLDRSITCRIAESLGCSPPANRPPQVMSADFLVDVLRDGKLCLEAFAIKPSNDLEKESVLKRLEIERRFWVEQGILFRIVTEREFSPVMTKNLQWLRTLNFAHQSEPWAGFHWDQAQSVIQAIPRLGQFTMKRFCSHMDRELDLELGSTLALVRHLLLTKAIGVDMTAPLNDHRPMADFMLGSQVAGQEAG